MTADHTILCPIPLPSFPHLRGREGRGPAPSCPPEELAPLLELLRANEAVAEPRALPRGTLLPDGRLDLCKQSIGVEGCKAVTSALAGNTVVRSLLLGTNGIGDEGAAAVADLVSVNRALEVIYLGCNGIGAKGAEQLAAAVAENPTISGLWLKRNPICSGGLRAVANLVRCGAAVRTLDLVNIAPGEPALCEVIAAVAEQPNAVACLYLGGNALDEKAAPALVELLGANENLRGLFLNVNCFGDAGARRLADGLARNRGLRALGLASNGFGPAGIAAIARALCGHPNLNWLDFGFSPSTRVLGCSANRVCGEAAPALAELLAGSPQLAELNLTGTGIDGRGLETLASAAERNLSVMNVTYTGPRVAVLEGLLAARRVHYRRTPPMLRDVSLIRSVYR